VPASDADDVARRRAVRERTIAFNEVLDEVCALYIHCRFDKGAVFNDPFTSADVSNRDYFHPSIRGQARLAQVTWSATFDFTDQAAPISTAVTILAEAASWCPSKPQTTSGSRASNTGSTLGLGTATRGRFFFQRGAISDSVPWT
jgi:hypothetical protein